MAQWHVNGALGTDDASHGTSSGAGAWKTIHYAVRYGNVSQGDVITVAAGTYDTFYSGTNITTNFAGTFTGTNHVRVVADGEVVMVPPSTTTSQYFYPGTGDGVQFEGVQFLNSNNSVVRMLRIYNNASELRLKDCDVDGNGAAVVLVSHVSASGAGKIVLDNTDVHNSASNGVATEQGTAATIEIINGSRVWGCAISLNVSTAACPTSVLVDDSCIIHGGTHGMCFIGAGHTLKMHRSIGTGRYNDAHSAYIYGLYANSACIAYWKTNTDKLEITDTKWWMYRTLWISEGDASTDSAFGQVIGSGEYFIPISTSCCYAHPGFEEADIAAGVFTPDYSHPVLAAPITGTAAFFGDSIMRGTGASSKDDPETATAAWAVFGRNSGLEMVSPDRAAIGGMSVSTARFHIDRMLQFQVPQYVFTEIGINNLLEGTSHPILETNETIAAEIIKILQKIDDAGAIPCWLGMSSNEGSPPDNANVIAVNGIVAAACETNGWLYGVSLLSLLQQNSLWNQNYEGGGYFGATSSENGTAGATLATDLHPNNRGHALIAEAGQILLTKHTTGIDWGLRVPFDGTLTPPTALDTSSPIADVMRVITFTDNPSLTLINCMVEFE